MISMTVSGIRRVVCRTGLLCPIFFFLAAAQVSAQDNVETVPTALYSYLPTDGGRQFIDLGVLSEEYKEIGYSIEDLFALEAETVNDLERLRADPRIEELKGAIIENLREGILEGGTSTGAAMVILNVTAIATQKCEALSTDPDDDFVVYKDVILGRSSLRSVQYAKDEATQAGLGRGQFDIYTTKFALCRNQRNNDIVGIPINVRWVINVNGDGLMMKRGNLTGPKGKPYQQNFHAEGEAIQVVLMEIDGQALAPDHPVYLVVENACIDVWLTQAVGEFDMNFPVSIPGAGVFCAGGCKDVPPGVDATQ